jgi:hypothetical protein
MLKVGLPITAAATDLSISNKFLTEKSFHRFAHQNFLHDVPYQRALSMVGFYEKI